MLELKQGDIIVFPCQDESVRGMITKIRSSEYVSCVDAQGNVYPHVYVGFITRTDETLPISKLLKKIDVSKKEKKGEKNEENTKKRNSYYYYAGNGLHIISMLIQFQTW